MTSCSSARSGELSPCQSNASSTTIAFGTHHAGIVPHVRRSIARAGLRIVSEQQVLIVAELSGDCLGVGIEQQLRVIEAKTPLRTILAAHLVAIELAGPQALHARMPDKLVATK